MLRYIVGLLLCFQPLIGDDYYTERTKGVLEQALENNSRKVMCGRVKIKDGSLEEVRNWFSTLKQREDELTKAFILEGVEIESIFLEHTSEGDFLIYYMRQQDIEKVYSNLEKYQLPVRLFHVEHWKQCCDECIVLEPLFDLSLLQEKPMAPPYLYKILSMENWNASQNKYALQLPAVDDEHICFSLEDQLDRIISKYWNQVPQFVVLKIDTQKLHGKMVFEANPGGVNKYYHLYEGSIPLEAVSEVKVIIQSGK